MTVTECPSAQLNTTLVDEHFRSRSEVCVANAPSHMTHFNGERFLGPY